MAEQASTETYYDRFFRMRETIVSLNKSRFENIRKLESQPEMIEGIVAHTQHRLKEIACLELAIDQANGYKDADAKLEILESQDMLRQRISKKTPDQIIEMLYDIETQVELLQENLREAQKNE